MKTTRFCEFPGSNFIDALVYFSIQRVKNWHFLIKVLLDLILSDVKCKSRLNKY